MADLFPKFIIENGCIILGKVTFHKELATAKSQVSGGGWYRHKDKTFTLYGESHDFGGASLDDIKSAVKNGKVYTNKYKTHNIQSGTNFLN